MSIGKPYYVNTFTKESVWERPTEPAQPSSERVFNLLHYITNAGILRVVCSLLSECRIGQLYYITDQGHFVPSEKQVGLLFQYCD